MAHKYVSFFSGVFAAPWLYLIFLDQIDNNLSKPAYHQQTKNSYGIIPFCHWHKKLPISRPGGQAGSKLVAAPA
ncbi:hypothetical protein ACTXLJ_07675 [Psychrobacter celer]|uniref:hypothetical protein n=1 Tax=Psychrobacter celer TaxID=306572 RepID=UPI003FD66B79